MVRFRMASLIVSFLLSSALTFLAVTQKIGGIPDIFDTGVVVDVKVAPKRVEPPPPEPKVKPPVPPPVIAPKNAEPVVATPIPVGEPQPPTQPAAPAQITGATWLKRPGAREFDRYYPARAVEREKDGRVVLNCAVNADGTINCMVASETPAEWGFGPAAIQISKFFKMAPQTVNGEPTSGGMVTVPITFKLGG